MLFSDVLRARAAIAPHLKPTPVLESEDLSEVLGCRAVVKCENLNPTGAFKVRGGVYLISTLSAEQRARGVLAVSTGNHAQSIAYAARLFRVPATIYMPEGANRLKAEATRRLGARVVFHGHDFEASRQAAERHAASEDLHYIHSGNEPALIAGVATAALELLESAPDLEVLFVPVGGGSGVVGAGLVARAVNPAIRVIGVQSEGAPSVYRSWQARRVIETDRVATFAEGLATRRAFELPLSLMPDLVDEIMLVRDEDLGEAIRVILDTTRQVAEGAGAAAVAGAMARRDEIADKNVGLVLSGGNLTPDQLRCVLDHHIPGASERGSVPRG
jgi:threonine dehydratase